MYSSGPKENDDPSLEKFTRIPDRILRKVEKMLAQGENIEVSVRAIVGTHIEGVNVGAATGRQAGHPWLILTRRRVILASPGLISFELRQLRRDSITSVELQQGVMRDRIIINGMGLREEWLFWRKLRDVTQNLVSRIQNDIAMPGVANIPAADTPDPISELKLRLARGEISETEFDSLKRKLS